MSRDDRPRWLVKEKSLVGHALVEEDAEVFYVPGENGGVGANLWPLNDSAQEIVDEQDPKLINGVMTHHPASAKAKAEADKGKRRGKATDADHDELRGDLADGGGVVKRAPGKAPKKPAKDGTQPPTKVEGKAERKATDGGEPGGDDNEADEEEVA